MSSCRLWHLKLSKEHLREASRNCLTAAATRIVLNGGGMRSHTGTVVSETSPTTVWCQWFLRALPLESNTTMWEKLGSQRLLNWLLPSREKPPGAGYRWLRERCVGSQSGGVVSGVCLPLAPGPLEKSLRARPSDCVYERLDYEWLHQATDGTTLPSAWDHCCNLWQPKTRGQDGAFIAVHQLHWGKLDLQQSLAPKCWSVFMQSIRTNNNIEGWHHSLNRRVAGWCGLPFYMSVALLHKEVRLVLQQIRLVSKCKRKRMQRSTYHEVQSALWTLRGLQQEGEVIEAAAQRICQYKQTNDALNWTELRHYLHLLLGFLFVTK